MGRTFESAVNAGWPRIDSMASGTRVIDREAETGFETTNES